jgi:hypothetical protein
MKKKNKKRIREREAKKKRIREREAKKKIKEKNMA